MNEYRPEVPRAAFALCAVGMAVITLASLVVAPAALDSGFEPVNFAGAPPVPPVPIEVAISPSRIEVFGVREPDVAWALPEVGNPCKPTV